MAKRSTKTRKAAAKRKKASRSAARRTRPAVAKTRAKAATKKRKTARKAKAQTFGERVSSAFKTVTGTITDVGALRRKLEQPGSDETE
jgi:hypothetical protein